MQEALLRVAGGGGGVVALGLQVAAELGDGPGRVGGRDVGVPVLVDEGLEVGAGRGGGVGDVVVCEPAIELGFVPFVVGCGVLVGVV